MSDLNELPLGPERRRLMQEQGFNVGWSDFSPEEQAQLRGSAKDDLAEFARQEAADDSSS